jgi:hypothetical protein
LRISIYKYLPSKLIFQESLSFDQIADSHSVRFFINRPASTVRRRMHCTWQNFVNKQLNRGGRERQEEPRKVSCFFLPVPGNELKVHTIKSFML